MRNVSIPALIRVTSCALLGACASTPEFVPTPVVFEPASPISHYEGLATPPQRAWYLDSNRWFEMEPDHACFGRMRFVDRLRGIDSFVAVGDPPSALLDSDDPDIVLAGDATYEHRLIYSTDGGRSFVADPRRFESMRIEFMVVRRGHLYIGLSSGPGYVAVRDGYHDWRAYTVDQYPRNVCVPSGSCEEHRDSLAIMSATVQKQPPRVGLLGLLVPKGAPFMAQVPGYAKEDVHEVEGLDRLGLPTVKEQTPRNSCKQLALPPWVWSRDDIATFVSWYEATKAAHPGWANDKSDALVKGEYDWYIHGKH